MSFIPKKSCCITPDQALDILKEGNVQYQTTGPTFEKLTPEKRYKLSSGQCPIAVILSCSDSRVPPELIFNQEHGNLFVIRIAGNIITKTILASIEFALIKFNISLIVIMGHSMCGAIIQALSEPDNPCTKELTDIIKPALVNFSKADTTDSKQINLAVKANIKHVTSITTKSKIIKKCIKENKVKVIGAFYKIKTGEVSFFSQ